MKIFWTVDDGRLVREETVERMDEEEEMAFINEEVTEFTLSVDKLVWDETRADRGGDFTES